MKIKYAHYKGLNSIEKISAGHCSVSSHIKRTKSRKTRILSTLRIINRCYVIKTNIYYSLK